MHEIMAKRSKTAHRASGSSEKNSSKNAFKATNDEFEKLH